VISPRWRKVWRDVWLHKSRTLLVVLAIAIGILGAGSVLNTWSLLRRVTREGYLASNPPSATIRTDSVDAALLTRVRAMPGIRAVEARRLVVASVRAQGAWRSAALFALGDLTHPGVGKVRAESGAWPPADGAFVVEHSSVGFAGIRIGDSVTVQVGDSASVVLPVTGIAQDVGLPPGWMEHVVYAFVTPATLARLGAEPTFNELRLIVSDNRLDRDAIRRIAFDVKAAIEATGRRVRDVDVPEPGRHIHAGQIDSLLYTQGAFGLLALLLSGFLVVNLISAMLVGQVREIGVMKTIGAREGQIATMYLGLAFVLGLAACAVALPLAAAIGRWYAAFTGDLLNFDITGFSIPRGAIALQLAVGALLPVIAAAVPVIRGCRISVAEALRDFGLAGGGDHVPGRILNRVSGLTRPLLLSLRNAFRRRQRMALTLLTLAMGGAVYLGALNLKVSIRGAVDLMFGPQRYDIALRFAQTFSADSLEAVVRAVPGVAAAEAWSGGRASVQRADSTLSNNFPIVAAPAQSQLMTQPVEQGRWLRAGDGNALVVNRRLMQDEASLTLGAVVTLIVGGRPSRWTVVGVVAAGPSPSAWAPRETMASILTGGRLDFAVVSAQQRGPASQIDLVRQLRSDLAQRGFLVQSSQRLDESRHVLEDHLLMVAGFLEVMARLMIVVGGLGLASTMGLAVLERTREIGVLRAIGARHRSILVMVQVEGLVIGVMSWLIAIPLSLPMSGVLASAFGRIMVPVPATYLPDWAGVMQWLAVVIVVSVVSCAWPAFRAMRVPTAVALAYD
jgi:putative ABC transport system permease protein